LEILQQGLASAEHQSSMEKLGQLFLPGSINL
jgi:hypothetical protein